MRGIPLASCEIEAELTTPTGAAIAATLADEFGPLPAMTIERIGYGAGDRDLKEQGNILRLIVGQAGDSLDTDQVVVLETNLDDVTGEVIGHCVESLLEAGALDAYTTPIQMKKSRPAVTLTVLCPPPLREKIEGLIFQETTTLGIRRWLATRSKLAREAVKVETPWGTVAGKAARLPNGQIRFSPEYDACRVIARENNVPLTEVMQVARQRWST